MDRGDRRLQRVGAEAARRQRPIDQAEALGDRRAVPERAVLVGEEHELARWRGASRTPRFVKEHQGQETEALGLGEELDEQPAEPDRLAGKVAPGELLARRRRIALVEDEIDDVQHHIEPVGEL